VTETTMTRPEQSSMADVTLVTRGITVTARVVVSNEIALVVAPRGVGTDWKTAVKPGDPVELFWVGDYQELTLPAHVRQVDEGQEPLWHLVPAGPVARSQRRRAVRAWVELPVVVLWAGATLSGKTLSLSEAGARVMVDGWGLPPERGVRTELSMSFEDKSILDLRCEIVRNQTRGAQWILAMRFLDVPEQDEDRLRRRVFRALREQRLQEQRLQEQRLQEG
jgi:c-di-GMP-binding flagellar brake protein YcgR